MRIGAKNPISLGISVLAIMAGALFSPRGAYAEADNFGTGDGHSGAKSVAKDAAEVINTYAVVIQDIDPGATTIQISNKLLGAATPTPFAVGDLVLVWRATGVAETEVKSGDQTKRLNLATAAATTSKPGTNAPGLVGLYEFARVKSVATNTLTLDKPMVRGFAKGVTQVVRVPEYTTVNVAAGGTLLPTAWQAVDGTQGWAGGILIFLATGAVTNEGRIHANGRGFHGGLPPSRTLALHGYCPNSDGEPSKGYAEKGEGVVESMYTPTLGGRGNVSMAGGGGNCIRAGGGGGANLGNGGSGGTTILDPGEGGLGGVGIDYSLLDRITMGGGGGAGEQGNGQASSGGFGGGAIYIRSGGALIGKEGRIEATGDKAQNSGILGLPPFVESEGAGGGGAGGSIFLRFAGAADCSGVAGVGGNGGNSSVIGQNIMGAGGGGGGGRVLFQASAISADCKVDVKPGDAGNGGKGGSTGGGAGGNEKPPAGGFCSSNDPATSVCTDPTPICDLAAGTCKGCEGGFGSGDPLACNSDKKPVCMQTGDCKPCNGDLGSTATQACQTTASPYCASSTGECGKCTTDNDCTGATHAGPKCNVKIGACGTPCTADTDCKGTEWCSDSVCVPKTPNGQPLPAGPPIGGQCTDDNGKRVCLSAVCDADDDKCGLKNGEPCAAKNEVCRSEICFAGDELCGKPVGEPCKTNGECRSDECKDGTCTGCQKDADCKNGEVCDANTKECVAGCRTVDGKSNCPAGQECSTTDGSLGTCQSSSDGGTGSNDGGADGGGNQGPDNGAAALDGIIEGGGCSCRATAPSGNTSLGMASMIGVAVCGLAFDRRRKRKRNERTATSPERFVARKEHEG